MKSKKDVAKVMVLCESCIRGCHLGCCNPKLTASIPKTAWFCPWCVGPCGVCDKVDVFDDTKKRLLQCSSCQGFWHMHCLATPLLKEPEGKWRCGECNRKRMVTRSMRNHEICASCHGDVSRDPDAPGVAQCGVCATLWHMRPPCLKSEQHPRKGTRSWRCPRCPR